MVITKNSHIKQMTIKYIKERVVLMATTYNHIQLGVVDANGNVNVLYPVNTAGDVSVDKSNNERIPSSVTNVQDMLDTIGTMAFDDGEDLVYLGTGEDYSGEIATSEINDDDKSYVSTWSSKKLNSHVEQYAPTYSNTLDLVNYLPITATTKVINGKDSVYQGICPEAGRIWFVSYVPAVLNNTDVEGSAGATNTVSYAMETWAGYKFESTTEDAVTYRRIYIKGTWGAFKKIS